VIERFIEVDDEVFMAILSVASVVIGIVSVSRSELHDSRGPIEIRVLYNSIVQRRRTESLLLLSVEFVVKCICSGVNGVVNMHCEGVHVLARCIEE